MNIWMGSGHVNGEPKYREFESSQLLSFQLDAVQSAGGKVYTSRVSVTVWGERAKALQHLADTDYVEVVGQLKNESWTDKSGVKQWRTVVNARQVSTPGKKIAKPEPVATVPEEEIPF